MIDRDEDDIAALRRQAEREAYAAGRAMLADPKTPPTARASVIRAFLVEGRNAPAEGGGLEAHELPPEQLERATRRLLLQLDRGRGEVIDVEPEPPGSVFD